MIAIGEEDYRYQSDRWRCVDVVMRNPEMIVD